MAAVQHVASDEVTKLQHIMVGDLVRCEGDGDGHKGRSGYVAGWRLNLKTLRHMALVEGGNFSIELSLITSRVRERGPGKGEIVFS